ncbi:MAG: helix-turn-helix domain-containing protein [Lachnospiraceae bacterium]|nr:helix-turn-helix domain-containing protein [Lachnospiraceae bacterium]
MPIPLNPGETIYVERKVRPSDYAMPSMAAAFDHYTLGLQVSGDRKWFSYETIQIAHAGNAGLMKPNVFHRNLPLSDEPYDRYLIKFRYEAIQPVTALIGEATFDKICMHYLSFDPENLPGIQQQFEDMLQEYQKNSEYSQFLLQGMLQRLILTIYQQHLPFKNTTLKYRNYDARIHNAMIYLEENLEQAPSIEEAARYVSLSVSHFSRLFKEVTGCSFTDYVTSIRLQHAQILLAKSELSIGEIALKVGFSNGNYLCNVFKRSFGCSPSEFRKQI